MRYSEIIKRRREFSIPGYTTLTEAGLDGDWVSPIQISSCSKTGPVLVAQDWLDAPSAIEQNGLLLEKGYDPSMKFNIVLDMALSMAGLCRQEVYITQAFHLLPSKIRSQDLTRLIHESSDRAF